MARRLAKYITILLVCVWTCTLPRLPKLLTEQVTKLSESQFIWPSKRARRFKVCFNVISRGKLRQIAFMSTCMGMWACAWRIFSSHFATPRSRKCAVKQLNLVKHLSRHRSLIFLGQVASANVLLTTDPHHQPAMTMTYCLKGASSCGAGIGRCELGDSAGFSGT